MVYGPDAIVLKQGRENPFQHLPVRQHVRNTARHTEIIFQHGKAAIRQADQIRATDADINSAWHVESAHLATVVPATVDQRARNDSIGQYSSGMVDVFQEHVQGGDALRQSLFDLGPFVGRDDPRKKVVGKDALGSLLVAVNGESDALMQEGQVGSYLVLAQFFRRKLEQRLKKVLV